MKLVITGAASAVCSAVLPVIEREKSIAEILAIDVKKPEFSSPKMRFVKMDIRDSGLGREFKGYDTLLNFAFIVAEIFDKQVTRDININGVRNIFDSAVNAGFRKIIHFSSIAAYGAHPDNPIPIPETWPLRGHDNDECFYACQKVETEAMLRQIVKRRPEMVITVFRPGVVLGSRLNSDYDALLKNRISFRFLGKDTAMSAVHQDDIATAVCVALVKDYPGEFNLVADDYFKLSDIGKLTNQILIPIPFRLAEVLLNMGFHLHIPGVPISRQSLKLMEYNIVASNEKLKKTFGWKPLKNSQEAMLESYNYVKNKKREKMPDARKRFTK